MVIIELNVNEKEDQKIAVASNWHLLPLLWHPANQGLPPILREYGRNWRVLGWVFTTSWWQFDSTSMPKR